MQWQLTQEQDNFRREVHEWLEAEMGQPYLTGLADRSAMPFFGIEPEFSRRLGEAGYLGITTPREFGGTGRSHVDQALLQAELAWAGAPILGHFVAEHEVLPALVHHGTPEQREQFIPELLAGRMLCSQGFTEPGTGSDLAGVQTSAVKSGGEFVINGVKWLNSVAHKATHLWIVARTNPDARHRGLTMFLLPVGTPGVRIEPLVEMTGIHRLNRLVFENVRVPLDAVVGEVDGGWAISMETVNRERAGAVRPAAIRKLLGQAAATGEFAHHTDALAQLLARSEVSELLNHQYAWQSDKGQHNPDLAGSTLKIYADEVEQDLGDVVTSVMGRRGELDVSEAAPFAGRFGRLHVAAPGFSLGGGTTEILKGVIATRALGLPREDGKQSSTAALPGAPELASLDTAGVGPQSAPAPALSAAQIRAAARTAKVIDPGGGPDATGLKALAVTLGAAGASGLLTGAYVLPELLWPSSTDTASVAVALGEGDEDLDLTGLATEVIRAADGSLLLRGVKSQVLGGNDAEIVLVAAKLDGQVAIVRVPMTAAGVTITAQPTINRLPNATLAFADVTVTADDVVLGEVAASRLDAATRWGLFTQAAESFGVLESLLRHSVEHGRARHAFGRPIGSFQSYQHHCAEIAMDVELSRAALDFAVTSPTLNDVLRARVFIGQALAAASRSAIQMQGGRGFLDDNEVARLYRQAKSLELRFGSAQWSLREFGGRRLPACGASSCVIPGE